MDKLNKEALISLIFTIVYLVSSLLFAHFGSTKPGLIGFPIWFEISCIYIPLIFILATILLVKFYFKEIKIND